MQGRDVSEARAQGLAGHGACALASAAAPCARVRLGWTEDSFRF